MSNEIWRLEPGWLAGYTQDKMLIRRIKRYKGWAIMARYSDGAVQYRIPIAERRPAERMFNVETAES